MSLSQQRHFIYKPWRMPPWSMLSIAPNSTSTCFMVHALHCTYLRFNMFLLTVLYLQALGLGRDLLAVREVDYIDIADDKQMTQSKLVSAVAF